MARAIFESLGFFLTPFVLYALFLIYTMRHPLVFASWSKTSVANLAIAGLLLAIAGFVVFGLESSGRGAYVPAHIENGRLTPGRLQ
jgi:hypothetical protein